ncbi:hypothetical protein [Clostridium intestinale]|uniref:Uncharacterized protein n=1 Tax=Clostridium intestinale DSM 6191 TaxID=1121320 RepID=A0A1M5T2S5_9CLOT|nr:hypothetical protein [Clostridium intestinale]SHH44910.1 hypothetical protein SAMN02745941_00087 [Clostridium intestinale DSM 6191]
MSKCRNCGNEFNVSDAIMEFNDALDGEYNYDEEIGGALCFDCAIYDYDPEYVSNSNLGRAIQMMNGDEDYDDEFVKKWL